MARNRKRRSAGRLTDAPPSRPGVATARPQRTRPPRDEPVEAPREEPVAAPEPIEHAAPDAELAEAQLSAGEAAAAEPEPLSEVDDDEELLDDGQAGGEGPGGPRRRGGGGDDDSGGELSPRPATGPATPRRRRNGLVAFAQGSWRELQRVQWPDQRQVVQATGVVIGFVIVAGAWLGVADYVATKIVHFILS